MISKDSVKNRLEAGISYTEFTYQLIQGYDFYWLWKNKDVKIQLGGSDQWGNILTGNELIRKIGKDNIESTSKVINNFLESEKSLKEILVSLNLSEAKEKDIEKAVKYQPIIQEINNSSYKNKK